MAEIVQARVWQKVDTYNNWMSNDLILGKGEMALVVGNGGIPLNMRWGDGTKAFRDLPNAIAYDQGQFVAVVGNALPSVTGVGYTILGGGTYTQTAGGNVVVPDGKLGVLVSSGGTWSLQSEVDLSNVVGTDVLNPNGQSVPKEKAVADYVDVKSNEIYDSILKKSFDINVDLNLTPNRYVSVSGSILNTSSNRYEATADYIDLKGASQVHYIGSVGLSDSKIAIYDNNKNLVKTYPSTTSEVKDILIDIPDDGKYIRATYYNRELNGASLNLLNIPLMPEYPLSNFRIIGTPIYGDNGEIESADIIWNDGSTGIVNYGDWNERELTYTSFTATSVENNKRVIQPIVEFSNNGLIVNYPKFIIENL